MRTTKRVQSLRMQAKVTRWFGDKKHGKEEREWFDALQQPLIQLRSIP